MNSICPANTDLIAYAEGCLKNADAERVAEHVDACAACAAVVEKAESAQSIVLSTSFSIDDPGSRLDEPQLRESIEKAQQVRLETTRGMTAGTAAPYHHWPEKLGEYQLGRIIGQGGNGTVFEALHGSLQRVVAIKLLSTGNRGSEAMVRRFRREVMVIGQTDHPGIVRATDAGEFDGFPFLVMEYVDGCDFSRLARHLGRLSVADACELVHRAAVSIDYLDQSGLVHRDVKPSNLMLTRKAEVKLLDLGLVGPGQSGVADLGELTETGHVMGSLGYMAPEQANSSRVDIRADIYGLGSTLYMLLVGHSPLSAKANVSKSELLDALISSRPLSIRGERDDLPHDLAALIDCMLARNPAERPQRPSDVAQALQPFASGDLTHLVEAARVIMQSPSSPSSGDARQTSLVTPLATDTNSSVRQQRIRRQPDGASSAAPALVGSRAAVGSHRVWIALAACVLLLVGTAAVWWRSKGDEAVQTKPAGHTVQAAEAGQAAEFPTPESSVEQPSTPVSGRMSENLDMSLDRQLAEHVLRIGGSVDVLHSDDTHSIERLQDLPEQPFFTEWIMLTDNPSVDDELLRRISRLSRLTGITLQYTHITDEGAQALAACEFLKTVQFYSQPLTDEGVHGIVSNPNLEDIVLSETRITDRTLETLATHPRLGVLYVKGTAVTDAGLRHVGQIRTLEELDLRDTGVTDLGVRHLHALTRLTWLSLQDTSVTSAAVDALRAALPACEIEW